jgi:apolipoprotein N-acyltransferase
MTSPQNPTQKSLFKRYGPDRRILLSTLFLFLTFEPLQLWPFAMIALIPWFDVLARAETRKEAVRQSFWLCFLFSIVTFYWIGYVIHEFGQVPWVFAGIAVLLFACIGQPQFYLAAVPLRLALRRLENAGPHAGNLETGRFPFSPFFVFGWGLVIALFYSGLDWTLPKLFVDTLGHSLVYTKTLRQAADIGGPAFLTFLLVLPNIAIYEAWRRYRSRGEPAIFGAVKASFLLVLVAIAGIIGAHSYGKKRLAEVAERLANPKRTVRLSAIQANIGDMEKLASERGYRQAAQRVMRAYYDLSDEAIQQSPKPDALLWPETAYPSTFRSPETSDDFARDKEMESFVASRKVPIAFGGYDKDLHGRSYNAVFYLKPDGTDARYAKTILIPFGEYIPLGETFPFIKRLFPMVGFFGQGPGPVVREFAGLKTQPVICYEVLFPSFVREAVVAGAEAILNFTNDSWFGPVGVPYYHLNLASFRSIETRVPQFRTTNTGFSALILPDGEIVRRTALYTPEIMTENVPVIEPIPTLVLAWGDWFGRTAFAFSSAILLLVYSLAFKRSQKLAGAIKTDRRPSRR